LLNFQLKQCPSTGALWLGPNPIAFLDRLAQLLEGQGRADDGALAMDGNIFNSRGYPVGRVLGTSIFDLKGRRIYDLKGTNIYKLSGELVGHLPLDVRSSERRLDKSTDKLFRGG
jgi:hypothetical protein